ncbi:PAS-domain containing protein [Paracoccaceae bacterium GXU_MW_L88]
MLKPSTLDRAQLLQAGLDLIQPAISIFDSRLRLVVWNRAFEIMFALPPELFQVGTPFDQIVRTLAERGEYGPIDNLDEWVAERVLQAERFEPHYFERVRANGGTLAIEGHPLDDGGWVAVYTDISAAKAQEALLRERSDHLSDQLLARSERLAATNRALEATVQRLETTKRELLDSKNRTRLATEVTPAHIAHMGRNRIYTYSNRQLEQVIPGRPRNIVGLDAETALGSEAYAAIAPYLDRAFAGEKCIFEFDLDGLSRRIRAIFAPVIDEEEVVGISILSMDVTEEAKARAILQQSRKRELAAQMTSGLVHDFGNLLTIMLGLEDRLSRMDGLPEDARHKLGAMRAAAMRGTALLDNLTNFTGRRELRPRDTDLTASLKTVADLARPTFHKDLSLQVKIDPRLGRAKIDEGFFQDAVLNLIFNARDAIRADAGRVSLTARKRPGNWFTLTVHDSGPGFSESALNHALDPFFTTKSDGTGLGLASVYDFAQMCGGRLTYGNRKAGGAYVTLLIPHEPAAAQMARRATRSKLVLLVEDTEELRHTIRDMLRDMGHQVVEAISAEEALELAHLPEVEAILSDLMLAGEMTGLDLARALPKTRAPILMTALPRSHPLRRAAETDYPLLAKPFGAAELREALE